MVVQGYSDAVVLGWYVHWRCWRAPGVGACAAEECCGITSARAARALALGFTPKSVPHSCSPRLNPVPHLATLRGSTTFAAI